MGSVSFDHFARALTDARTSVPSEVVAHTSLSPTRRFSVYRNNVAVGLIGALEKRFPAARKIVGEEFFHGMAQAYVERFPPRSPILMVYGDDFPDFIFQFAPAAEIAYLADVARLEAARTKAYHAADAKPLAPSAWVSIDPIQLSSLGVRFHPSVAVISSTHPIVTIWAMNSGQIILAPIEDWFPEDGAILRPDFEVFVKKLPVGGGAFFSSLQSGQSFGSAVNATSHEPRFDLPANLAMLISGGFVVEILSQEPQS